MSTRTTDVCYLFDLEGTISNCDHRKHLAPVKPYKNPEQSWDKFHQLFPQDEVIPEIADMMRALWFEGGAVFILTGMMAKHQNMAKEWLSKNHIGCDGLLMRDNDDFTPAPIYKLETVRELFAKSNRYSHIVLFDDREDIVDLFNKTKEITREDGSKLKLRAFKV